tara:strand:- start:10 stop:180 length:171 start_codon:yes stop_codon:yes gene_type:complete
MNTYKLGCFNTDGTQNIILTESSGKKFDVPPNPENTHYQEYLDWVAEGNTPTPADS